MHKSEGLRVWNGEEFKRNISMHPIIPARVVSNRVLSQRFRIIEVRLLTLIKHPKPVQFFMVWSPGVDELPLSVAGYSLSGEVTFIYEIKGSGTRGLSELKPDSFVGLKGPLGRPLEVADGSTALVVAGGSGVAPVPFITKYLASKGYWFEVVWGVKRRDELFNLGSLMRGVEYLHVATEDCSTGYCGLASELARSLLRKTRYDLVIGVGPKGMLKSICNATSGVKTYVVLEAIVKCGLGLCGSCVLQPTDKLLCVDGPAFKCEEVIEYLEQ